MKHRCIITEIYPQRVYFRCFSENSGKIYPITYFKGKDRWNCECEGYIIRNTCSHIDKAKEIWDNFKESNNGGKNE